MLKLPRPPQDDDELWWLIKAMIGVELPRKKVCPDHVSPFDAVAHAFFGMDPNFAVWYASRGSGKSLALASLGIIKAFTFDVDVTILGGSMTQSLNVREHMRKLMGHPNFPHYAVSKDTATVIEMTTGRTIKPLPASETTVRGPHPPLQLLDEVDEMEYKIYNSSLGQAMEQKNALGQTVQEYVVASSTWQNPEGTFTKVIEDARDRGLPIFTWCWRELLQPHGWMSKRFIENKKRTVSSQMWHTEYELNEPAAGSRALDLDKVALYFQKPDQYGATIREEHKNNGDFDTYTWEDPQSGGSYAVGADWAKEKDKTIIAVVRYDMKPYRLVKLIRVNRMPWDQMIGMFNEEIQRYQAVGMHDKTGLGSVINDYVDFSETTKGFVMVGRPRTQLLLDYITSFEHGDYRMPHIPKPQTSHMSGIADDPLYRAHRGTTVADVYAPGNFNTHLPDDFAAMALAHRAISTLPRPTLVDSGVPKDGTVRDVDKPFHYDNGSADVVRREGEIEIVDERYRDGGEFVVDREASYDPWEMMSL